MHVQPSLSVINERMELRLSHVIVFSLFFFFFLFFFFILLVSTHTHAHTHARHAQTFPCLPSPSPLSIHEQLKYNTHVEEDTATGTMKEKITQAKMRRNTLRHEATQKERRLEELRKQLHELELEEVHQEKNSGGGSAEMQKLRTLENRLDKATIKFNEAQHIGKTYKQIIRKLEQDRLHFDNNISDLEKTLAQRKEELVRVEVRVCANQRNYSAL